jgi:DNA repair exonuclease SbcCD ATPase subunit
MADENEMADAAVDTRQATGEAAPAATDENIDAAAQLAEALAQVKDLTRQLGERDAKMGELQQAISEKGALVEAQAQELSILKEVGKENESKLAGLSESFTDALKRYRDLALVTVPDAVADLVVGDTIDAIDASLAGAKALVAKVKSSLELTASEGVSAGSPPRSEEDWRDLPPKGKIIKGLNES